MSDSPDTTQRPRHLSVARPVGARNYLCTLAALTHDYWTVVARRVRVTARQDGWEWRLSPREVSVLHIAVTHGSIELHHARRDGQAVQVAKLARRPAKREGEAFAIAGMGMFEQ